MLLIRPAQQEHLREHALSQYVERTLAQFHRYFPGPCYAITDQPLRAMIRLGVKRAALHGFKAECNVVLYTSLMLLLGSFFDEDGQYPWARQTLSDESLQDESQRAELLYDLGFAYWKRVAGPNSAELVKSIVRTRKLFEQDAERGAAAPIADRIRQCCPVKADAIGPGGVQAVIRAGETLAREHRLSGKKELTLLTCLAFGLGCGFDRDPLYPWASQALLADGAPERRADALYQSAAAFGDRWLTFVRREE